MNLGYAALQMTQELGFSNETFGVGAGIFFIGYFLIEIPATVVVEVWSARKWISRIMITWGFVAALTAFVGIEFGFSKSLVGSINSAFGWKLGVGEFQFYFIRFLLGLAEAHAARGSYDRAIEMLERAMRLPLPEALAKELFAKRAEYLKRK